MSDPLEQHVVDEICRLYLEGQSTHEIAARLGIGRHTTLRWLRKRGVAIRPRGFTRLQRCSRCGLTASKLGRHVDLHKRFDDLRGDPAECWPYDGHLNVKGYGASAFGGLAHRTALRLYRGVTVPKSMEVDHLCRNRACVNPDHLEIVTHLENIRRGWAARRRINAA